MNGQGQGQGQGEFRPLDAGSMFWRLGYPRTNLLTTGRALIMQVSHPTIAAGILKHSKYLDDPWGRMRRSRQSTLVRLFGGTSGIEEGVRLRNMHSHFNGIDADGSPFQALDREPWQWTYSATFDSILYYYRNYSNRAKAVNEEQLYQEWRAAGRQIGIAPASLPDSLAAFEKYVDDMVRTRLTDNAACKGLLRAFTFKGVESPWRFLPRSLWSVGRQIAKYALHVGAVGSLPSTLRSKLGVVWTSRNERDHARLSFAIRTVEHMVPRAMLHDHIAYLAMRAAGSRRHKADRRYRSGAARIADDVQESLER